MTLTSAPTLLRAVPRLGSCASPWELNPHAPTRMFMNRRSTMYRVHIEQTWPNDAYTWPNVAYTWTNDAHLTELLCRDVTSNSCTETWRLPGEHRTVNTVNDNCLSYHFVNVLRSCGLLPSWHHLAKLWSSPSWHHLRTIPHHLEQPESVSATSNSTHTVSHTHKFLQTSDLWSPLTHSVSFSKFRLCF